MPGEILQGSILALNMSQSSATPRPTCSVWNCDVPKLVGTLQHSIHPRQCITITNTRITHHVKTQTFHWQAGEFTCLSHKSLSNSVGECLLTAWTHLLWMIRIHFTQMQYKKRHCHWLSFRTGCVLETAPRMKTKPTSCYSNMPWTVAGPSYALHWSFYAR
jgi:hypothetical protein